MPGSGPPKPSAAALPIQQPGATTPLAWLLSLFRPAASVPPPSADFLGSATLPHDAVLIPPVPALGVEPAARFDRCVAIVLRHEGGFVDHPRDRGRGTNRGITIATLASWRGHDVTVEDVIDLTDLEARRIYRARFWNAVQGDMLPAGLDLALFDFAVNSGPGRAARMLQTLLAVETDGAIGPRTLGAIRRASAHRLVDDLCRARLAWLRGLDNWDVFGRGWEKRVVDVRERALAMAR